MISKIFRTRPGSAVGDLRRAVALWPLKPGLRTAVLPVRPASALSSQVLQYSLNLGDSCLHVELPNKRLQKPVLQCCRVATTLAGQETEWPDMS